MECLCGGVVTSAAWSNDQCRRCWKIMKAEGKLPATLGYPSTVDLELLFKANAEKQRELLERGGPGTIMMGMLKEADINTEESCGCRALAAQMNAWGVECLNHLSEIVSGIKTNMVKMGYDVKIKRSWPEMWEQIDEVVKGIAVQAVEKWRETLTT